MKLQYLGDSKDCFKWDYLNFLMSKLGYPILNVVPMMTPEDGSADGRTRARDFKGAEEIFSLCCDLEKIKSSRQKKIARHDTKSIRDFVNLVKDLPGRMALPYRVEFHKAEEIFTANNRKSYFRGFDKNRNQVVFADPDNGFEPKNCSKAHIKYAELFQIMDQISDDSIILVFQHFRRKNFKKDFKGITEKIKRGFQTAVYWNGKVMFVSITKSGVILRKLICINEEYARQHQDVHPVPINESTQVKAMPRRATSDP